MGDNIKLGNGLTLGGMFQEKEKMIQQLEEENRLLRTEKAQLTTENKIVLQEQAQAIKHLNQQLSRLTGERTNHFSTVELLDSVKMEKDFLEEELKIQYDHCKKQKDRIILLEDALAQMTVEKASLETKFQNESKTLQEEQQESFALSCLVGERDITIEKCRAELTRMTGDLETLKHAVSSKDTKLKSVVDERNAAVWKLQDLHRSPTTPLSLKKKISESNIPTNTPRTPKSSTQSSINSISPITIAAFLTPEKVSPPAMELEQHPASPEVSVISEHNHSMLLPVELEMGIDMKLNSGSFDIKEKHYLSLIYRLRTELAKVKKEQEKDLASQPLTLKAKFSRKPINSSAMR